MTNYILWQQGANRPYPVLLKNRDKLFLTDFERRAQVGAAIEVKSEHEELYLDQVAKHYPCPGSPREHQMSVYYKLLAKANDPSTEPAERDAFRAKAKEFWDQMGREESSP